MHFLIPVYAGDKNMENKHGKPLPAYLHWPHMQAGQVRGLALREIGGGFTKHHRAPSIRSACYAIAKPSTMLQKMQNIKKLRGHRNAVYCGTWLINQTFHQQFTFLESSCFSVFFVYLNLLVSFSDEKLGFCRIS